MQTLGLADSTPRTESRLKSLFWPSVTTAHDVDYLGTQGYWVCVAVAVLSFAILLTSAHPFLGALVLLFYYLGGVGVRERSRYAAVVILVSYGIETLPAILLSCLSVFQPVLVLRVLLTALLLSNLRAIWIASGWKPEAEEAALPPRLGNTWSDKFADRLPTWLWPKVRILFYVCSVIYLVFMAFSLLGFFIALSRRMYDLPIAR